MKKITIILKDEEHKNLKKYLIDKEQSIQKYIVNLINKDMDQNKNEKKVY